MPVATRRRLIVSNGPPPFHDQVASLKDDVAALNKAVSEAVIANEQKTLSLNLATIENEQKTVLLEKATSGLKEQAQLTKKLEGSNNILRANAKAQQNKTTKLQQELSAKQAEVVAANARAQSSENGRRREIDKQAAQIKRLESEVSESTALVAGTQQRLASADRRSETRRAIIETLSTNAQTLLEVAEITLTITHGDDAREELTFSKFTPTGHTWHGEEDENDIYTVATFDGTTCHLTKQIDWKWVANTINVTRPSNIIDAIYETTNAGALQVGDTLIEYKGDPVAEGDEPDIVGGNWATFERPIITLHDVMLDEEFEAGGYKFKFEPAGKPAFDDQAARLEGARSDLAESKTQVSDLRSANDALSTDIQTINTENTRNIAEFEDKLQKTNKQRDKYKYEAAAFQDIAVKASPCVIAVTVRPHSPMNRVTDTLFKNTDGDSLEKNTGTGKWTLTQNGISKPYTTTNAIDSVVLLANAKWSLPSSEKYDLEPIPIFLDFTMGSLSDYNAITIDMHGTDSGLFNGTYEAGGFNHAGYPFFRKTEDGVVAILENIGLNRQWELRAQGTVYTHADAPFGALGDSSTWNRLGGGSVTITISRVNQQDVLSDRLEVVNKALQQSQQTERDLKTAATKALAEYDTLLNQMTPVIIVAQFTDPMAAFNGVYNLVHSNSNSSTWISGTDHRLLVSYTGGDKTFKALEFAQPGVDEPLLSGTVKNAIKYGETTTISEVVEHLGSSIFLPNTTYYFFLTTRFPGA